MNFLSKTALLLLIWANVQTIYTQESRRANTTIFWDSSFSMKDRDLESEIKYLDQYFQQKVDADVTLMIFSNAITERELFRVETGNWEDLKSRLSQISYDGGTSFSALSDYANGGDILVFTDGQQNTNIESPYLQGSLTVINSSKKFNKANLNLLVIVNSGTLVNLASPITIVEGNVRTYFGKIQGSGIQNVGIKISIKGRDDITTTPNSDGNYELEAALGDTLIVATTAGKRVEKALGDKNQIDIWLGTGDQIELEEVVLVGEQEEPVEVKTTAAGDKNADAVGYAVQSITEEDIPEIATTVNTATQGKFSGVTLGQNDDLSQVIMRPSNSILGNNYGLIVVDGVPLARSNSSVFGVADPSGAPSNDLSKPNSVQSTAFLDPRNIAKITVLKGLAATNRFGSMGANGVILITTKTGSFQKPGEKKDLALVTDNLYDGKIKVSSKVLITPYLKALKDAKNLKEAYNRYLKLREQYAQEALFFIDIYDYFKSASPAIAGRVLTNILEDDKVEYTTLRAMLLKCREDGLHVLELDTALRLLERFPDKIQSYLDHALALKANGAYQQCYDQLVKMADGSLNPELDFGKLKKSIEAELKNLVYQEGKQLKMSASGQKYNQNLRYDVRIVFEWSFPPAEFELQFVNPQKRFFTWEHTSWANDERLKEEFEDGFAREEFEIVGDGIEGEWLVNVKYLGNTNSGDQTPTILMAKIIYDFGKTTQKEEIKLLRLFGKENESQFLKLNI